MTRDEIDETLTCLEEAAHDIFVSHEYGDALNAKLCEKQKIALHAEILAEFDRLNAEIERLKEAHPYRWYQELIDDLNSEIELMQQENMYSDDGGDDA